MICRKSSKPWPQNRQKLAARHADRQIQQTDDRRRRRNRPPRPARQRHVHHQPALYLETRLGARFAANGEALGQDKNAAFGLESGGKFG